MDNLRGFKHIQLTSCVNQLVFIKSLYLRTKSTFEKKQLRTLCTSSKRH